jgi:hypothetical protein
VGYVRRNFMTPFPVADSFDALNARFLDACMKRRQAILRGQATTIGERMQADTSAFMPLPPAPYDACHKVATRVSSLSLVRYRNNDYSVPTRYGHQEVLAKGYVDRVEISCRGETIATTIRCITLPCWNRRARRSIRPRRSTTGASPIAFIVFGG